MFHSTYSADTVGNDDVESVKVLFVGSYLLFPTPVTRNENAVGYKDSLIPDGKRVDG